MFQSKRMFHQRSAAGLQSVFGVWTNLERFVVVWFKLQRNYNNNICSLVQTTTQLQDPLDPLRIRYVSVTDPLRIRYGRGATIIVVGILVVGIIVVVIIVVGIIVVGIIGVGIIVWE